MRVMRADSSMRHARPVRDHPASITREPAMAFSPTGPIRPAPLGARVDGSGPTPLVTASRPTGRSAAVGPAGGKGQAALASMPPRCLPGRPGG